MNLNRCAAEIQSYKGRITPQLLFDFCIDYGYAVTEKLQMETRIEDRVNPYVVKEATRMMEKITRNVRRLYDSDCGPVNVDQVLNRIDPTELAEREFTCTDLEKLFE